ncbi:NAD-dependent epimerase/dehydratase family protein [Curtobacterium pusillum]|uniref:NAD-dependent epimerase/dehydratase family protein n=1 Tax=Curtobacterium pusillum TaxID=69373 RepID=A0ABX2M8G0_9MICO|nr:NAD-dependent epimerase/dehydratase family protein [Curtobacterium pusillum]NUU14342.1 NAD-dependent epimerase/dehydratase family protein [Curtobacterium pusillum]
MNRGLIGITGRGGLIGWHLRALLYARGVAWVDIDLRRDDPLDDAHRAIDHLVHVAGITHASPEAVREGNIAMTEKLIGVIDAASPRLASVTFANSVQSRVDSPYGVGKSVSGELLRAASERWGADYVDVMIENAFGERGLPHHNTVTSTFCHRVVRDEPLTVATSDERVFVHAQDIAEALAGSISHEVLHGRGTRLALPDLAGRIRSFERHRRSGTVPPLPTRYDVDLWNTLVSFAFGADGGHAPGSAEMTDGELLSLGPDDSVQLGFRRRASQRVVLTSGRARLDARCVLSDEQRTIDLGGAEPTVVDVPALWTWSLTNAGDAPASALVTAIGSRSSEEAMTVGV